MIAVAQHHRREVLLPPLIEVAGVIELNFVRLSHIERFIQHQDTDAIACIQERGGWRVMRRSHGIVTSRLEQLDSSFFSTVKSRRSEGSVVMMNAAADQLDGLPIEHQAFIGRPGKRPHAKAGLEPVDYLAALHNFSDRSIERWALRRPKLRTGERDLHSGFVVTPLGNT